VNLSSPPGGRSPTALRILHVYKDYHPVIGGIENHVRALAEAQAAQGHQVRVLVTASGLRREDTTMAGVRLLRSSRLATVASTPLSPDLALRLALERPDLTHLHAPYPVAELAWLLAGRRPMVLSYHADVVRQKRLMSLWAPGLRTVLRRASAVIAGSPAMAESSPFLREVRGKVFVAPYGIDTARFDLDPTARAAARARWRGDAPEAPWLVFVGRLRYYKGLHVLLEALAALPEVRLLVVGSGPMGVALRTQAEGLGIAARLRWLGDVSDADLPGVLAAGDAFVLPAHARSEAFGIAMLEAMAAGLPVVSTELGTGTSWLNQDGRTGVVVEPGDPQDLAAGIDRLLSDPARRDRLAAAAAARASERFSRAAMVARVGEIYARALNPVEDGHADPA
jgi:rhamnosyl/mannosyltransferase